MMFNIKILSLVISILVLAGCGTTGATARYEISESKTWTLQDAPSLKEVIKTPIANVADVAQKVSNQFFQAKRKEKFETDDAYKARVEKSREGYGVAFFVKSIITNDCTKYDFQKNIYTISCKALRPSDKLYEETKSTGKKTQLANAYTSREVEFFENRSYRLSVTNDALAELNISSDDAKKIDKDLMVGVLISIKSADYDLGGCGEADIKYDIDKICKSVAFSTGAAFQTLKYMIVPDEILETVIYLKSSDKVLAHKKYKLVK